MKAPARPVEQDRRDCLVRGEWLSAKLDRAQSEKILVEIYRFRIQERWTGQEQTE